MQIVIDMLNVLVYHTSVMFSQLILHVPRMVSVDDFFSELEKKISFGMAEVNY